MTESSGRIPVLLLLAALAAAGASPDGLGAQADVAPPGPDDARGAATRRTAPLAGLRFPAPPAPGPASGATRAVPLQDDGGAAVHEMTLAGAFTALPGGLVGAVIGYYAGRSADDREWGGLDEVGAGALFGLALGAPVGVHVVNGRRGSIGLELGAAVAVGGIAWALAEGSAPPAVSIGTSVLGSSLVAALIERHTGS